MVISKWFLPLLDHEQAKTNLLNNYGAGRLGDERAANDQRQHGGDDDTTAHRRVGHHEMIRGIHHVAICTPDLDRLAAFYRDVMGFDEVMSTSWRDRPLVDRMIGLDRSAARQLMLKAGNAFLELFEYESPTPTPADPERNPASHGYTHFCIDVTDIDAEQERLAANGMSFHSTAPTVEEMGGVERLRAIYARDPDGNIVELQEVLDPSLPFTLESTALIGDAS